MNKTKAELLDNYGIVKCSKENFREIDNKDFVKYKENKYEIELLTENRHEFKKKYINQVIDKPTIDEIMLIYIKGENSNEHI